MPRHRQEIDFETVEDGDAGFLGVNALLEPSLLRAQHQYGDVNSMLIQPGMVSEALNKRFAEGKASTRRGIVTPLQFNTPGGWGQLVGSGVFSDPNGSEWLMLAEANQVRLVRDGLAPVTSIPISSDCSGMDIEFVQAFDRVIMFRGPDNDPLQWSGNISEGFEPVERPSSGLFVERIPSAAFGVVMAGRMFVPYSRDVVAVSDIADYASWDSTLNSFRINSGEDDAIVALHPFRKSSLIVFKDRSVHRITGVEGDLSTSAVDPINSNVGCVSRRSVATVGGDIYWLSDLGVMRFTESVQDSMVAAAVPISEPIQPIIERINKTKLHLVSGRTVGRYYYLSVPLDDSKVPNAIIVYDTVSGFWQGIDMFPDGVILDRLHSTRWIGRRELFSINLADGFVYVHNQDKLNDRIDGVDYEIEDSVTSRGYIGPSNSIKRWSLVNVDVATLNASLTIEAIVDGPAESKQVKTYTPDRLRYSIHGKGEHPISNGALHGLPHRQDYTIKVSDGISMGADVEVEQSGFLGAQLRSTGRWVSIRIKSSRGACSVRSIKVEGELTRNHKRAYV